MTFGDFYISGSSSIVTPALFAAFVNSLVNKFYDKQAYFSIGNLKDSSLSFASALGGYAAQRYIILSDSVAVRVTEGALATGLLYGLGRKYIMKEKRYETMWHDVGYGAALFLTTDLVVAPLFSQTSKYFNTKKLPLATSGDMNAIMSPKTSKSTITIKTSQANSPLGGTNRLM